MSRRQSIDVRARANGRRRRDRLRRITGVAVASAVAAVSALVGTTPAYAAPFDDSEATVYLAQGTPRTQLMGGSQLVGELTFSNIGSSHSTTYNAIGYNELDDYIYGVSGTRIVRVHSNGVVADHKPAAIASHIGAFQTGTNRFYYSNGSALYWTSVASTTSASHQVTLSQNFGAPDFTWKDGYFWGLGTGGTVYRLSTGGTVTSWTVPALATHTAAGGAWTYGNGNLGFTVNASGAIIQLNVANPGAANPTFSVVSVISGPDSSNNDATASLGSPADLAVAKSASVDRARPGDAIRYELTVTNNGTGVSSGYTVSDPIPEGIDVVSVSTGCDISATAVTCSGGRTEVGASATFTVDAVVAADAVSGPVENVATVLGNEEDSVAANNRDAAVVDIVIPSLRLEKTAELVDDNGNGVADLDETVEYTFEVENTGDLDLTGVTIDDPDVDGITPASIDLPVGATGAFTAAARPVTQADVDAGIVTNTATASGTDELGGTVTSDESSAVIDIPADPGLEAIKSAELQDDNGNGVADAGETISYTIEVTNTGNVTLEDVTVDDSLIDVTPASVRLAPDQVQAFSGDYEVTPDDVDNGSVVNTATASGTTPGGDPIDSPPTTTTTETVRVGITIVKSAEYDDPNGDGALDLGEQIVYRFVVTNTGNVTLEDVVVDDSMITAGGEREITPALADIEPGEQVVFVADPYTVTEDDVLNGQIENTATATGTPIGGDPVESDPSTTVVPPADPAPSWTLVKRAELADANANDLADIGETITYTFLATNTGNVTLSDVTVSDDMVAGIVPDSATLIPGQQQLFTSDPYEVTQPDIDAGQIVNEVTGAATDPNGEDVPTDPSTVTVPVPEAVPGLSIVKSAELQDTNGNGVADEGETVGYTFTVRNTGNVTLFDVSVEDERVTGLDPALIEELAPDAVAEVTADPYPVSAADVEAGTVANSATATGTPPGDGTPITSDPSTTEIETVDPSLTIVKSAALDDLDGDGMADVGEEVTYSFVVTNTGNTRLEDVGISDDRVSGVTPVTATIEPDGTQTFVAAPYVVTEEDVVAGELSNTATAHGTVPGGATVSSDPSTADVPTAPADAALELEKTATLRDDNGNGLADEGEVVVYGFVATNTGNRTVTAVSIEDPRVTGLAPAVVETLAPRDSVAFTADPYVVTAEDIAAGEVENSAVASAVGPDGEPLESPPSFATLLGGELADDLAETGTSPVDAVRLAAVVVLLGALAVAASAALGSRRIRRA